MCHATAPVCQRCALDKGSVFALDHIFDNAAVRMAECDDEDDQKSYYNEAYPVVAFSRKTADTVWEVFQQRYKMFNTVYLHKACVGRELLLQDMLRALGELPSPACNVISGKGLADATLDPADFAELDDQIVTCLRKGLGELLRKGEHTLRAEGSWEKAVRARTLLARYMQHTHYSRIVCRKIEDFKNEEGACPSLAELKARWNLPAERFAVTLRKVHHGDGARNPIDHVRFFKKTDDVNDRAEPLAKPETQLPIPINLEHVSVCVYFKGPADEWGAAVAEVTSLVTSALSPAGEDEEEFQPSQGFS